MKISKSDNSFPFGNFFTEGASSSYGVDRDSYKGASLYLIFIRENISSNVLAIDQKTVASLFAKLNLHKLA